MVKIWGCELLCGGHNLPPMVEIRLTDLPKLWGCHPQGRHPCYPDILCGGRRYHYLQQYAMKLNVGMELSEY